MSILFQFLFFGVASILASRLITNNCHIPFCHEDYLPNRNEQTQTSNSIEQSVFSS